METLYINWNRLSMPNYFHSAIKRYSEAIHKITYKDWRFEIIVTDHDGHALLLAHFTDQSKEWTTRKYYLSPRMTDSEIIQTAFLLVKVAEEHELREKFLYKGRSIFGPHFDSDKLHGLCEQPNALDVRD